MAEPCETNAPAIRVATSSCLLGEEVRFDGGHKHNGYLTKTLARYFELIPVCPEVAIGLRVPRRHRKISHWTDPPDRACHVVETSPEEVSRPLHRSPVLPQSASGRTDAAQQPVGSRVNQGPALTALGPEIASLKPISSLRCLASPRLRSVERAKCGISP